LAVLDDESFKAGNRGLDGGAWQDLVAPEGEGLVISDFDGFKDFIAIYARNKGVP